MIALIANNSSRAGGAHSAGGFWLRVAVVTGAFAFLRFMNAHMIVEEMMRDASHVETLEGGIRPGQLVMLIAVLGLGIATAGLLFFRLRTLHRSIFLAAISLVVILLLAVAHSASLYLTGALLQTEVGPFTLSRLIEGTSIALLVLSGLWYTGASKDSAARA